MLTLSSCSSDESMESLNTDPTKAASINPNSQLTTAILQTYGDLDQVEMYRNYVYAFTQQLMGCWNTTNYGGRHTADNTEMARLWTTFYDQAIKNLVDAEYATHGDDSKKNINAALNIYKVYLMSLITDTYGDVPYSEAGLGFIKGIANPKYDTQESIYYDFFNKLDTASMQLDASADELSGDVIYAGDVAKWKKLANSLRLRYAMRISDVAPDKAKEEFTKALKADGGIMDNAADDALIKYMDVAFSFGSETYEDYRGNALSKLLFGNDPSNNPSYICATLFNQLHSTNDPRTFKICRCYWDKLMSSTSPTGRIDLTNEMIAQGRTFNPNVPGGFSWEPWPTGYDSDTLAALGASNPAIKELGKTVDRETEPKIANNFLKSDNPGVVMTSAEVKFLLAEATLKGWISDKGTVADLYKQGVREAMDLLHNAYGCEAVGNDAFEAFIAANGIGHTAEQAKKAINIQAWILHFTNPSECWANQRRSGYPQLKSPAEYGFAGSLVDGQQIPVRLRYPVLESSYNKANYDEVLDRMGGEDSWYTHVWWDVK
ncbi:MAG: SusD/RagB family nutrient-binding outer membrane lipoprotein [Prevotella sp.]